MHSVGFEPTHPKILRPERSALDPSAKNAYLCWTLITNYNTLHFITNKKYIYIYILLHLITNTPQMTRDSCMALLEWPNRSEI